MSEPVDTISRPVLSVCLPAYLPVYFSHGPIHTYTEKKRHILVQTPGEGKFEFNSTATQTHPHWGQEGGPRGSTSLPSV